MRKQPTKELVNALVQLGMNADLAALRFGQLHVNTPIVCDHCEDDEKEAFPYGLVDAQGREWQHLCNECFDKLLPGSSYEHVEDGQIVN